LLGADLIEQLYGIVIWEMMAERVFGVAIKILAIKERNGALFKRLFHVLRGVDRITPPGPFGMSGGEQVDTHYIVRRASLSTPKCRKTIQGDLRGPFDASDPVSSAWLRLAIPCS
jgi:hypothetical protein